MSDEMKTYGNKVLDELALILANADREFFPSTSSTKPVKLRDLSVKQTKGVVRARLDEIE